MDKRQAQAITALFIAFGKQNDTDRMALYCKMLSDVPGEVLQKVTEKAINDCEYLPSIATLRESLRSLIGSVDETKRVKPWVEVQKEIQQGLTRTWYHGCLGEDVPDELYGKSCEPKWSSPEVKAAVDSYGLDNLNKVMESDMPIVWSQLRKAYEQACESKKDNETNTLVLQGTELKQLVGKIGLIKC